MPLYEYYSQACNRVFELLRPVREAANPQPCPDCDRDAKRIVSKEWAAFIDRDGIPRRLPDRGKYWNLFEESDTPMTTSNVEAPEARPRRVKQRQSEDEPMDRAPDRPGSTLTSQQRSPRGEVLNVRKQRRMGTP